MPTPEAVRPAHCPGCGSASRPLGAALNLVGHGLRPLLLFGIFELGASPQFVEIRARRYRCLPCGAVCMVVPSGVLPGRKYTGPTIALALMLWALRQVTARQVRQALSPFEIVGASVVGWASLRQWARAYGLGDGALRERAAQFALALLATSPLSAQQYDLEPRIYAASLQPERGPSPWSNLGNEPHQP